MQNSSNAWQRIRNWAMSSKAPAGCARCAGDQRRRQEWRRAHDLLPHHVVAQAQVRLLLVYRKGVKDNLTAAEKKVHRKLNADW